MGHHTKVKGDLGVFKAQADLAEQGWVILVPMTEHSPFDLVAYKDGEFRRVQVKYRSVRNGSVRIQLRSSWADRNGTHDRPIDKKEIDICCVYCPETGLCYYFDPKKHNQCVMLRILPAKNNQSRKVRLAADLRIMP